MARYLALPWYDRQDWSALHELFVERDSMPFDYDTWKQRALRAERRYRKKGYEVVRVTVTPQDLQAWCRRSGRAINLNARHEFALERMGTLRGAPANDIGRAPAG
ncbi:MAG: hypothetical protein AB7R90_11425 [Reyranellaceae bacterium]